ncbi:hypothetical protein [Homoserinimonas sp. A520]
MAVKNTTIASANQTAGTRPALQAAPHGRALDRRSAQQTTKVFMAASPGSTVSHFTMIVNGADNGSSPKTGSESNIEMDTEARSATRAVSIPQRMIDPTSAPAPQSFRLAHTKYPLMPAAAITTTAMVAFSVACAFQTTSDSEQCAAAFVALKATMTWA